MTSAKVFLLLTIGTVFTIPWLRIWVIPRWIHHIEATCLGLLELSKAGVEPITCWNKDRKSCPCFISTSVLSDTLEHMITRTLEITVGIRLLKHRLHTYRSTKLLSNVWFRCFGRSRSLVTANSLRPCIGYSKLPPRQFSSNPITWSSSSIQIGTCKNEKFSLFDEKPFQNSSC